MPKDVLNPGFLATLLAFLSWGVLPLYWKALQQIPAPELLAHRIVWSALFLFLILAGQGRLRHPALLLRRPGMALQFGLTSLFIGGNWLVYIWAVNAGYVVETSLGYFINPLVNVLLGYIFLKEDLRRGQVLAVLLAAAGVLNLTLNYGRFPWIALVLAASFGSYGLLRKKMNVPSLPGLGVETGILAGPALVMLVTLEMRGQGHFGHSSAATTLLLVCAGIVTSLPLLWFGTGVRTLRLSVVGMLQYIAPTCMFLLGVFLYREPFTATHLVSFGLIWCGLVVFSAEGLVRWRYSRPG